MKTWTTVIGRGRSAIEVTVEAKEHHERSPEEHARVSDAVTRTLGEPTPEMFDRPKRQQRRATARKVA